MSITAKELVKLREDHPTIIADATTLSDEQLDDLSIAVTRMEQSDPEAEQ